MLSTRSVAFASILLCAVSAHAQPTGRPELVISMHEAQDRSAGTPEARALRLLSIELESIRQYPCNRVPDLPITLRSTSPGIVIDVGRLRLPATVFDVPCSGGAAARGSVVLATPAPGRYPITIRHGSTDRYELIVTDDALRLVPQRARFSRRRGPETLARVPLDAVLVICTFGVNRDDCAPTGPSCQDLYADPVLASLPRIPRAGEYAAPDFNVDFPIYRADDVAPIRDRIQQHYRDDRRCLRIDVLTGRGDHVTSL